jgi:hypothetical protein
MDERGGDAPAAHRFARREGVEAHDVSIEERSRRRRGRPVHTSKVEDERVVAGRSEREVDPSPFIKAARIDAEHATVNGLPVGKVIEGGNGCDRSWRPLVQPRGSDRRPHSVHHTNRPVTSACPCTRCGVLVAQPHEAGPTRERPLDPSERRRARREQLIEEPIESGADKTDETILKHLSAVQRRGYTLGESTQVGEERIDLSTLEND